jgi:uncharacterized protein (DUF433 family)
MEFELSHSEKPAAEKNGYYLQPSKWESVMTLPPEDIEFDDDCPELDLRYAIGPVVRFKGKIVTPRQRPTDPHIPEVLAFMKARSPLIQMEPDILGGMPVFKETQVPIKRMFDVLLAYKPLEEFLRDFPSVPRAIAVAVLENEATLFYEEISVALDEVVLASTSNLS